jgi:hypothetical protein
VKDFKINLNSNLYNFFRFEKNDFSYADRINRIEIVEKNSNKEIFIETKSFLLLPDENEFNKDGFNVEALSIEIALFWRIQSACFKYDEDIENGNYNCEENYWSSYFPDPKSEFFVKNS